jgi:hypothetical protein
MSQQPSVLLPPPPPPDETNDLRAKQPGGRRPLPNIKVFWIRGYDPRFIQFKKAVLYMGLGQKESGKSALLETVACRYPKVIDLFGSRDCEGLAWCRSPFKNSVLFIVGDNVDVKSQWDTKSVSEVKLSDFEKYRVVLSCSAFHSGVEAEFQAMNQIVLTLYRRMHWEYLWFLMVREASNFIYSRLKISPNQTIAKADFLYLLREARHMGYPTGVDTLRWTGMDADARGIADYLFIKRVGVTGLPKELHFLYAYINPSSFMGMKPRIFTLISNRGPLALGHFDYPWWHKEEKEDMLKLLDIKIDAGDVPEYGDQARNTVSDFEHIRLVGLYLEVKSMQKVAKILSRSPATINKHISEHDAEVAKTGCCSQCKRVRGMHQNTLLVKRGAHYSEPITSFEEFEKTF